MKHLLFLIFLTFLVISSTGVLAQTAIEVIQKSEAHQRGESNKARLTMKIIRPDWSRSIEMTSWAEGSQRSLVVIHAPARDKGSAFLKRDNEIWNWVPSIGRVVKLPPSMMMQSWMGSDFTNDDLVRESSIVHDYMHSFLPDSSIEGNVCWTIQMIPKEDAPVVWGKVITWIDKTTFNQMETRFYDEDGYLVNTLRAFEIQLFDDRLLPSRLEMIPADKKGHKTVLIQHELSFSPQFPNRLFSIDYLKRVGG